MTFRGLKRRMERDERRELQKELGRWYYVSQTVEDTITTADGSVIWNLPLIQDPLTRKVTVYGVDLLVSLRMLTVTPKDVHGAFVTFKRRAGQSANDFFGTNGYIRPGTDQDARARFRSFLPIYLTGSPVSAGGGNIHQQVVFPFRLFRGNRLLLNPSEFFAMGFVFYTGFTPVASMEVSASISGRYRYIETPV